MRKQDLSEYSAYLHLYADGELFICTPEAPNGFIADLSQLEELLSRMKLRDGVLLYSFEDADEDEQFYGEILEFIGRSGIDLERIDPQPVAYGFCESYLPHLDKAHDAAQQDLEGLRRYEQLLGQVLKEATENTPEYIEAKELHEQVKLQLEQAKSSYEKISRLYFELCLAPKGVH